MNLIFLDTEFTNFSDPELISIGLVSSNDERFYAEVPYKGSSCSEFVHMVVEPLLSGNEVPLDVLQAKLADWLYTICDSNPVVICFDSDYDRILFLRLFENKLPVRVNFRNLRDRHINEIMRTEFYKKNEFSEHHALNDALALRNAFRGWVKDVR